MTNLQALADLLAFVKRNWKYLPAEVVLAYQPEVEKAAEVLRQSRSAHGKAGRA